jgi:uncharacterized SAM-dependent methyltransferase
MHLESEEAHSVYIPVLRKNIRFAQGERIHTENSYKYTLASVEQMLTRAGFRLEESWTDSRKWYSVHLARAV